MEQKRWVGMAAIFLSLGCRGVDVLVMERMDSGPIRDAAVDVVQDVRAERTEITRPVAIDFISDPDLGQVNDIWINGPQDIWFVADSGQIGHWTGGTGANKWNTGRVLNAVYGTPSGAVWVVGNAGYIADFDGTDGFDVVSQRPTNGPIVETWGSDQRRFLAGQFFGDLSYADMNGWASFSTFELGSDVEGDTVGVSGAGNSFWVASEDGFYGHDGTTLTELISGNTASGSISPIAVFALSQRAAFLLETDGVWLASPTELVLIEGGFGGANAIPSPPLVGSGGGPSLRDVWSDGTELWVVGTDGYIARIPDLTGDVFGLSWEIIPSGTTEDITAIAGTADNIWFGTQDAIRRIAR